MSVNDKKKEKYFNGINKVASALTWEKLADTSYQEKVGKLLSTVFHQHYKRDYTTYEDEFVTIPALIQTQDKRQYLALIDIDAQSSGEHWGTQILHPQHGFVDQNDFKTTLSEKELKNFFPYKYRPLIQIERDIHTDSYF